MPPVPGDLPEPPPPRGLPRRDDHLALLLRRVHDVPPLRGLITINNNNKHDNDDNNT